MTLSFLWQLVIDNYEGYLIISFITFFVYIDEFTVSNIISSIAISLIWPITYIVRFFRFMRSM